MKRVLAMAVVMAVATIMAMVLLLEYFYLLVAINSRWQMPVFKATKC